jgi:hypothetical protein
MVSQPPDIAATLRGAVWGKLWFNRGERFKVEASAIDTDAQMKVIVFCLTRWPGFTIEVTVSRDRVVIRA